jgi:dephospho-CoA kinase
MKTIKRIAVTGGIGAGKSFVTHTFEQLGVSVIDADIISRELTSPCSAELASDIVKQFGSEYILAGGTLNRPRLKDLVFSSDVFYRKVNELFHPLIKAELHRQESLAQTGLNGYTVSAIPLLIECGWQDEYDFIITVVTPDDIRQQRVMKRDSVDVQMVKDIERRQVSNVERLAHSDFVIVNSGDIELVQNTVKFLHQQFTNM